jgi:hypothetical protein
MLGGPLAVYKANVKGDAVVLKTPGSPSVYLSRKKAEQLLTQAQSEKCSIASVLDYLQAYPEQKGATLTLLEDALLR